MTKGRKPPQNSMHEPRKCSVCGENFYSLRAFDVCSDCTDGKIREEQFWVDTFLKQLSEGEVNIKTARTVADQSLTSFKKRFRNYSNDTD